MEVMQSLLLWILGLLMMLLMLTLRGEREYTLSKEWRMEVLEILETYFPKVRGMTFFMVLQKYSLLLVLLWVLVMLALIWIIWLEIPILLKMIGWTLGLMLLAFCPVIRGLEDWGILSKTKQGEI